jgi:hypothetical protein
MRNAYETLVGIPEGKRPPGRWRRRWDDFIMVHLEGTGSEGVNWIRLAQYRV